jgi:hypothetical protein
VGGDDLPAALQPVSECLSVGCGGGAALQREDGRLEVVVGVEGGLEGGGDFEERGGGHGVGTSSVAREEHIGGSGDVDKAAGE